MMAAFKYFLFLIICTCTYQIAFSDETNSDNLVHYEDVLKAQGDKSILIIDIRRDDEIQETYQLPGSVHIPMNQVTDVLTKSSNEEFEKQYQRKKPTLDTKIILSCASGRRSGLLLPEVLKLGYKNTYSYAGGFKDWQKHQKN